MAGLTSILRDIRGLNSDRARDRLPEGAVWELTDWVPEVLQAGARMRGAWVWRSDVLPNEPNGSIYAPFRQAAKLLIANGPSLREVPISGTPTSGSDILIPPTRQDPTFFMQTVIVPAADGVTAMRYITFDGTSFVPANAPVAAPTARFAVPWKGYLAVANTAADPAGVWYSRSPTNGGLQGWAPANSYVSTSYDVTGLAQQRNQVLVFHNGSVERLRGTTPGDPALSSPDGDLILDSLFDRAGCYDARSIAYWNENILFCDARGIFLTDGAAVRNLCLQGGVINLWLQAWERPATLGGPELPPVSVAAVIHRDYYIVTIRHTNQPPVTFVCEIPSRRFFMLKNVDATTFAFSLGQRERVFGVDAASKRVTDLTPIFDPDPTVFQVDGNGVPVLPVIATGWDRLSKQEGFKRIIDLHVAYEAYRDTDDEVLRVSYVGARAKPTEELLGEFKPTVKYARRKMAVRRRLPGVAFRLEQLLPTKDTRLHDISVVAYPEEESRL